MATTVDWATKVITVPKADLTFVSGTLYDLDTEAWRLELKGLEASQDGMPFERILKHNTEVTIAGTTFARGIQIINGYTVQFEDGQYAVRLIGSNNNIFDEGVIVRNQVSVISTNSAGLQTVSQNTPVEAAQVHIEATYDGTDAIVIGAWLERFNATVTTPISCSIDWRTDAGVSLFTGSSSSPDSNGHFKISHTQTLAGNTGYYIIASITDATGTVTTHRGLPTVGT